MQNESPKKLPRNTSGMAGVFWVAYELARRNWIAFPTVRNQKGVDIIATTENSGQTTFIEVQVKTNQKHVSNWLLCKDRNDIPSRESLFFAFVRPESNAPNAPFEVFVVPSTVVREDAHHSEKGTFSLCWWLEKDRAEEKVKAYKGRWDVLQTHRGD